MECIGYVGLEAFDVILYIGRTLTKLNSRVLIVDLSDSGALLSSIKHGMELDSLRGMVNYRDINYTRKIPSEIELENFNDGIVFVNYGWNYMQGFPKACKTVNIVVNTFPHTINTVNQLMEQVAMHEDNFRLLIRDVITLDDVDRVKEMMHMPFKLGRVDYLYLDINDTFNAVNCELNQVVNFSNITKHFKKVVEEQVHDILPNKKTNMIKNAMAAAKKGA